MLVPFVRDKWYTSWLFLWKTRGFVKGASVHLSGIKQSSGFQLWCHHADFAYTCVILHKTQTYEENIQTCSWETLNECPPQIYMSLKARDITLPEGPFSLVQANYFFQIAFSHLLWCLHFTWFRNYPGSQYKEYSLHFFMKEKRYRTENKLLVKCILENPKLSIWNQIHLLSQKRIFYNRPLGLTSRKIQMF